MLRQYPQQNNKYLAEILLVDALHTSSIELRLLSRNGRKLGEFSRQKIRYCWMMRAEIIRQILLGTNSSVPLDCLRHRFPKGRSVQTCSDVMNSIKCSIWSWSKRCLTVGDWLTEPPWPTWPRLRAAVKRPRVGPSKKDWISLKSIWGAIMERISWYVVHDSAFLYASDIPYMTERKCPSSLITFLSL